MKYFVNEKVKVKGSETEKVISEVESINGVLIYYMTDNTSYSEDQICNEYSDDELISKLGNAVLNYYFNGDRHKKTENAIQKYFNEVVKYYENEENNKKHKNETLLSKTINSMSNWCKSIINYPSKTDSQSKLSDDPYTVAVNLVNDESKKYKFRKEGWVPKNELNNREWFDSTRISGETWYYLNYD